MDKYQALQSFWSSFGMPAYDENTVPSGDKKPAFPYVTYSVTVSDFNHPAALSASIWDYGMSWTRITAKLTEIEAAIGYGGVLRAFDDGAVWFKKGSPFAQRMSDPDDMIRRIYMNIEAEFITAYE